MKSSLLDLEPIRKETLISGEGTSYLDFRKTLRPHYARVWFEIGGGWITLFSLLAILPAIQTEYWLHTAVWILIGGMAVGFLIAFLHLFFHEAVHFHLTSNRSTNDRLANFLMGPLLLSCVEFYRHIHMAHHRLLGAPDDTENSYFQPLSPRFLLNSLLGQRVISVLLNRAQTQAVVIPASIREKNRRFFLIGAVLHFSIVVSALGTQSWILAGAWCTGVLCFTPFFGAVRQLLEHRNTQSGQPKVTRLFAPGPFSAIFGAAGFNRHIIHHWDPTLSYTCFEKVEGFLLSTPLKEAYQAAQKSYFAVFKELYLHEKNNRPSTDLLELRQRQTRSVG